MRLLIVCTAMVIVTAGLQLESPPAHGAPGRRAKITRRVAVVLATTIALTAAARLPLSTPDTKPAITSCAMETPRAQCVAMHKRELATDGIPRAQRTGWATPFDHTLSTLLDRAITPINYTDVVERVLRALTSGSEAWPRLFPHPRNDIWRLYLGLPMMHGTLEISPHLPLELAEKPTALVYRFKDLAHGNAALLDTAVRFKLALDAGQIQGFDPAKGFVLQDLFFGMPRALADQYHDPADPNSLPKSGPLRPGAMGHFTVRMGRDAKGEYVEYVDRWNLDLPLPGKSEVRAALAVAKTVALVQPGLKRVLETVDRVGIPEQGTVSAENYYGKPLWLSDRIYYDLARIKKLVALENDLLGLSPEDYLMRGRVAQPLTYEPRSMIDYEIPIRRDELWEKNLPSSVRATLAELDSFYGETPR